MQYAIVVHLPCACRVGNINHNICHITHRPSGLDPEVVKFFPPGDYVLPQGKTSGHAYRVRASRAKI